MTGVTSDTTTTSSPCCTRRSAVIALLLIAPIPTVGVWVGMIAAPGTVGQSIFGLCKLWIVLMPLVWRKLVDKQPLSWSPARHGGFGVGLATGLAISLFIAGAYLLLGDVLIEQQAVKEMAAEVGLASLPRFVGMALYWITFNSLAEEYIFRWFITRKCEDVLPAGMRSSKRGAWIAIICSATIFTVHHVVAMAIYFDVLLNVLASLGVFIGGAVWSWMYQRYHSIWPGYLSHALVDVAIFGIGWHLIFT